MSILNNPGIKHIYCIGIGGISVSAIALLLLKQGFRVSGSDINTSAITSALSSQGQAFSAASRIAACRG